MAEEQLTDELLERLLASASPEAYLSTMEPEDRTLSEYLFSLLHDKGLSRSEVFEAAGIDPQLRGEMLEVGAFAAVAEQLAAGPR